MWNPQGSFKNDFIDNGNGTITDRATGLMWQKGGSRGGMSLIEMEDYIQGLNKNKFAGYSGWRVPTIDELASLVKRKDKGWGNIYINPVFEKKQFACWSSDIQNISKINERGSAWYISFDEGSAKLVGTNIYGDSGFLQKAQYGYNTYFIRAVRSVE